MKIGGVLCKSDNAIKAERDDRYPMTAAKRVLKERLAANGIKVTLAQAEWLLKELRCGTEWHHVSKFANEIDYYDVGNAVEQLAPLGGDEEDVRAAATLIEQTRLACRKKTKPTERTFRVRIEYTEWSGRGRYKSRDDREYEGPATIRGDWVTFDGKRKKMSGNWIKVTEMKGD